MGNAVQAIANSGVFNVGVTPTTSSYPHNQPSYSYYAAKLNPTLNQLTTDAYTRNKINATTSNVISNTRLPNNMKSDSKKKETLPLVLEAVGVLALGRALIKYTGEKLK